MPTGHRRRHAETSVIAVLDSPKPVRKGGADLHIPQNPLALLSGFCPWRAIRYAEAGRSETKNTVSAGLWCPFRASCRWGSRIRMTHPSEASHPNGDFGFGGAARQTVC